MSKLHDAIREIIIDPDRLEFGEAKVNLRVGGTVDRIDNYVKELFLELIAECEYDIGDGLDSSDIPDAKNLDGYKLKRLVQEL